MDDQFKLDIKTKAEILWPNPPKDIQEETHQTQANVVVNQLLTTLQPLITQMLILLIQDKLAPAPVLKPEPEKKNPFE